MKKIFTLALMALALGTSTVSAQTTLRKTWDFRDGFSTKTVNALKADQEEFGGDKYWRNYESDATKADEAHFWNASKNAKNADGFACTHNGGQEKVISELEGLVLGMSNAKKFVITYNGAQSPNEFESDGGPALGEMIPHGKSYVWLNGKNETIKFQAAVNQTIKIGVESHAVARDKKGEARGISLTTSAGSLELTKGNAVPTYYTECEWNLTGDEGAIADITLKSTNGCHIYYIIVGEGDDPNANKTSVSYITAGDATQEVAYQTMVADETLNVTVLDATTLTAEQLAPFSANVISPALPADNAGVATLKQALAFYPIVNLNANLYAAWGYGEASETLPIALVMNQKHELLSGLNPEEDFQNDGDNIILQLSEASGLQAIKLGDYFAGDVIPLVDGNDPEVALAHVHNPYHNAYIYIPFADDATAQGKLVLINAIDMAKGSKSEITKAPAPKINLSYKNLNTNIELAMASSTLPKSQIFYTLDGTNPTEQSNLYTDMLNVDKETVVKAVAIAEGYLLSTIATDTAKIYAQPATPVIAKQYDENKTVVTLTCDTEGADIWYNFQSVENDTVKSMKYTEPLTFTLPAGITVFSVAGGKVYSESASDSIFVKNPTVRQDVLGHFDANSKEWQMGGSGSTVYYFSWGKSTRSIYDTNAEPIGTDVDPETGDEKPIYPELDYEYYVPALEEEGYAPQWEVKSKGQVMIWQSLSAGSDPGNGEGYNPETTGDILPYAKITNNDIQFGGKTSGEPCTGAIQSLNKYQGPFDVVTHVGTAAGGDNVGRMLVEVSTDSITWTALGEEMNTSKVKRLWKTYTRSYNEADEVYVRVTQAGGGASVQIYDIFILNEGETSKELKNQYIEQFMKYTNGISDVRSNATTANAGIYNLNGSRQQSLRRGVNIVVRTDGTVQKVLVK